MKGNLYNEPWAKDSNSRTLRDCTGGVVAAFESHVDAGRAGQCVNALVGIEDPMTYLELSDKHAKLVKEFEYLKEKFHFAVEQAVSGLRICHD